MASRGVTKTGEAFCMACGANVEPGAQRCESCYSQLDDEVRAFSCPRCGRLLELGTEQCSTCSMRFKTKAVRPSDAVEDDRMVTRLIDWGRKGREERKAPTPKAQVTDEPLTMGEAKAVSGLIKEMSDLADLRRDVASDIGANTEEARRRIGVLLEAGPSGSMVEGIETELESIATDMTRLEDMLVRTRSLSEAVSKVFSMPGPSALAGNRGVSLKLPESFSGTGNAVPEDLGQREEQLRQREEMVDRKIKAYAQKKKELDAIEKKQSEGPRQASGDGEARDQEGEGREAALAQKVRSVHEIIATDGACDDAEACLASLEGHLRTMVVTRSELEQTVAQLKEGEAEVKALLKTLDGLLGQLPTDVVDRFSKSEEFKLYERVLDRLNV